MRAKCAANPKVLVALCGIVLCLLPLTFVAFFYRTDPEPIGSQSEARRFPPESAAAVSREIPRILSPSDAKLYHQVFTLQEHGAFRPAQKLATRIENKLLMGHVLAQRYLRMARPNYEDLRRWLLRHRDHPDARRIYRLAHNLRPRNSRWPRKPWAKPKSLGAEPPPPTPYVSKKNLTRKQRRRVSRIKRAARIWLRKAFITKTERLISRADVRQLLDRFEMDKVRAMIAAAWFYQGRDRKAYRLAKSVLARSAKELPLAHWTAGLAAWRLGKTEQAALHFAALAKVPEMSGWIGAGAALWASRAYAKLDRDKDAQRWLEDAARYPYTLYGVLALKWLGREVPFETRSRRLTADMARTLGSSVETRRALALIEADQPRRAEQELLSFEGWSRPEMTRALLALADQAKLPALALKLAERLAENGEDGRIDEPLRASLYPIPPWHPMVSSGIDQALLFAFMRQESDFDTYARSPVGARGLMQIMPSTARMLNRGRRFRGADRLDAYEPEVNVNLGQRYLNHLRRHKLVRGNLLRMIAGYNSGPGNIAYWAREKIKDGGDPLLFIESMPMLETRLFVRRVLANLWIYRMRLGQPAPSLDAIADGKFPRYQPIDGTVSPIPTAVALGHIAG